MSIFFQSYVIFFSFPSVTFIIILKEIFNSFSIKNMLLIVLTLLKLNILKYEYMWADLLFMNQNLYN